MKPQKPLLLALIFALAFPGPVSIAETEQGAAGMIEKAMPSVVSLRIDASFHYSLIDCTDFFEHFWRNFFEEKPRASSGRMRYTARGSGAVIDASGLIVTSAHAVSNAEMIHAVFPDGKTVPATLAGLNDKLDLAVLKIEPPGKLEPLSFGDSKSLKPGVEVYSIGAPYGYRSTVTRGIVSATDRSLKFGGHELKDLIQTDMRINPGTSGGPLLNAKGEMVGLATGYDDRAPNIGFAIPAHVVRDAIPELTKHQPFNEKLFDFRRRFGFVPAGFLKQEGGPQNLVAFFIVPLGRAYHTGIRSGDRIVKFAGKEVATVEELLDEAVKIKTGERVTVEIERDGKKYFTYLKAGS